MIQREVDLVGCLSESYCNDVNLVGDHYILETMRYNVRVRLDESTDADRSVMQDR